VKKTCDHTWEKPTEYQLEQVRIAVRAALEAETDDISFLEGGRGLSPTLRIWDAIEREKQKWKIN
jgi:hypothetical protein